MFVTEAAGEAGGVRETKDRRRAEGVLHRQQNKTGQVCLQAEHTNPMPGGACCSASELRMNVCVFRYIFLFDKVVIVCKRKGYSYELKEIIELQSYKMSDDPMNNRDMKKVGAILGRESEAIAQLDCVRCKDLHNFYQSR